MQFADRTDAGERLSAYLLARSAPADRVVGLPRGGIPVAFEVARALCAPLDLFVIRKLGVPGQEELAFGAVASTGVRVLNPAIVASSNLSEERIDAISAREHARAAAQQAYYGTARQPCWKDQRLVVVDDGLATGASMEVAVLALRGMHPARISVAVPVAPAETLDRLRAIADAVYCVTIPRDFRGVGAWYCDFTQVTDESVRELLHLGPGAVSGQ